MKLEERFKTFRPNTTSRAFLTNDVGVKCVHYGDIYKNYSNSVVASSKIINRFTESVSDDKVFECDSIIFPDCTETIDDFGHFVYIKYDGEPYINGTHTFAITCDSNELLYLFFYLQSTFNRLRLQTLLNGSTVYQLSFKNLNSFILESFETNSQTQQHIVNPMTHLRFSLFSPLPPYLLRTAL